jgi:recombination protein RecT
LTIPGIGPVAKALMQIQPALAAALPTHMKAERMVRIALTALRKNPKLGQCDLKSFIGAVMQAAQLGLEPDGTLGEAYLIPYGQECQLVPGYKGLLKLARQSGHVSTIVARAVHSRDHFEFSFGLKEVLEHIPTRDREPGDLTHVYAIARLKDGGIHLDVMSVHEVNRIRDNSQGYQNAKRYNRPTPWTDHYDEMAKKTVLRRLCKLLPASTELARAVAMDEAADAGVGQGMADVLALEGIEVPGGDFPAEPGAPPPEEGKRMKLGGTRKQMNIETPAPPPAGPAAAPSAPDLAPDEPGSQG